MGKRQIIMDTFLIGTSTNDAVAKHIRSENIKEN